ncbi:hypothetical protein HMI56_007126 [Coelomomyces lativittatus]|nr:hypothetical protein HMI56_007126 [Coelomomyces lativittatus]
MVILILLISTALAEAELEYHPHTSEAAYVKLRLVDDPTVLNEYVLIWTTQPWTLVANRGVAVHPEHTYTLIQVLDERWWVNLKAVGFQSQFASLDFTIVQSCVGQHLVHRRYQHPVVASQTYTVVQASFVGLSGTGLVHLSPGHGLEDHEVALEHQLEVYSPVDEKGCFNHEAPDFVQGKYVFTEGTQTVLDHVAKHHLLVKRHRYEHSYPYDWRTKQPVILRSTWQWFVDLSQLKHEAVRALETVTCVPSSSKETLIKYLQQRKSWCISRQRVWGVPIPVVYDRHHQVLLTQDNVQHIRQVFQQHGHLEGWWTDPPESFVATKYLDQGPFVTGKDTLDVWFDSGTSWTLYPDAPVDLYIEGTDQHRGWFQSSLLSSVATRGVAPFKKLITHGFVVDEKKQKMSKSIGNVVAPEDIIQGQRQLPKLGVDGLRLWVAQSEFINEISVGENVLQRVSEIYRKIRNTCKYLISNVSDYSHSSTDAPLPPSLSLLDKYILTCLHTMVQQVHQAYTDHTFFKVVKTVHLFLQTLSSTYFEAIKDRMYADPVHSPERRGIQYVLSEILLGLTQSIAPILPLLAEEIFIHCPQVFGDQHDGYFIHRTWYLNEAWNGMNPEEHQLFLDFLKLRNACHGLLEQMREKKILRSSLEARVSLNCPSFSLYQLLSNHATLLNQLFVTSQVRVYSSAMPTSSNTPFSMCVPWKNIELQLTTEFIKDTVKCQRCWMYTALPSSTLCSRCDPLVSHLASSLSLA